MRQIQMEDLGVIRFIAPPTGTAPLFIREKWVGIEVPCMFSHDGVSRAGEGMHEVMSGLNVPDYPGYVVLQEWALVALEEKSPEAAGFWYELGFPNHPVGLFLFNLESAEVMKPVMSRDEFWQRFNDA